MVSNAETIAVMESFIHMTRSIAHDTASCTDPSSYNSRYSDGWLGIFGTSTDFRYFYQSENHADFQ